MPDRAASPIPGVIVGTHVPREVARLRSLSQLLDNAFAIPGTPYRIGLDAIVGLVPGLGDLIGALFSSYIVFQAARLGAPRATLVRMIGNIGLDTLVGEIPLLGDLFDIGFKSNIKNMKLLEAHLQRPRAARAESRRVILLIGIALLVLLGAVAAIGLAVAQLLLSWLR
jgi:hypothetical protein